MVPESFGAGQSGEVVRRQGGAESGTAAGREQQGGEETVGGSGFQIRETWRSFMRVVGGGGRVEGLGVSWGGGVGERLCPMVGVLGFGNQS